MICLFYTFGNVSVRLQSQRLDGCGHQPKYGKRWNGMTRRRGRGKERNSKVQRRTSKFIVHSINRIYSFILLFSLAHQSGWHKNRAAAVCAISARSVALQASRKCDGESEACAGKNERKTEMEIKRIREFKNTRAARHLRRSQCLRM